MSELIKFDTEENGTLELEMYAPKTGGKTKYSTLSSPWIHVRHNGIALAKEIAENYRTLDVYRIKNQSKIAIDLT